MVCGLLCGLQKMDDIHDWAKSAPTKKFLEEQFGIKRIFSRAQFYNIVGCVDAERFKLVVIWHGFIFPVRVCWGVINCYL